MAAWLEGYSARLGDELADAKSDLAQAETESHAREPRRR